MSPDLYLGFAALFISYFLKVAVACLLCWMLVALFNTPQQRFTVWFIFLLGSLAYWLYAIGDFSASVLLAGSTGGVLPAVAKSPHELLLPARFQSNTLILGRVLGAVYVLGVLSLVAAGVWKRIRLRLLLRQRTAPSAGLQSLFSQMCRQFGVRHCELSVLPGVKSPATVYWWRPRIVLPQLCEQVNDNVLMADVLSHELAHVSRRDYLWSRISDMVCGLLFFHPAAWQARKQMRIHREMACDFAVVASRPEHRADYAQTLTRVARLALPRKYPVVGIDFAAAPTLLRHRVEAILDEPQKGSRGRTVCHAFAGAGLVVAFGFLCSMMAFAIAFAPSSQPRMATVADSPDGNNASVAVRKTRHSHPQPEGQQLITESPAYRLPSNANSRVYGAEPAANASNAEREPSNDPSAMYPAPASGRSPASVGKTVEAVIVSTVGTVIAGDKDDRNSTRKK